MREKTFAAATKITIAVLALAACGCSQVKETESILSAAGFEMKLADTPDKLAHLKTLTQHKLVPHERDGKLNYVYADASDCTCLYTGDEKSYQEFKRLAFKQQIANEQVMAAESNEDAAMNWGMWDGP